MASSLLETKFYAPRLRRGLVARALLREQLSRGAESRLTLICAPAGFGKTTLLAQWLAQVPAGNRVVAWVSLEESERRPASFWTYLLTSLHRAVPGIGAGALEVLQSAAPPAIESVLATVLNELSAVPREIDVVLDDYHLVDGPDLQTGMAFLLGHLPRNVHLIVSTRADPALPLARLRAMGELVEIRAAELRFSLAEVAAYLNEVMGLDLAPAHVAALEARTEGWIAALQLAALSMRGRGDIGSFIAAFAGDDRYIVDYLVEEVLGLQPDDVRSFLVRTCILDRLSGPLCDAVTGQADSKGMLASLDRANLFLVPLDDNRQWYRYHHLFGEVLHVHLLDEHPAQIAELHRRASQWYDENGEPAAAVRHALAAGDVAHAAGLIELAIPALSQNRQESTVHGWLDSIPDQILRVRPVLAIGFIGALMSRGDFEGVEKRLQEVEQLLQTPSADTVVMDEAELARLPAAIEMYRAALALIQGDPAATLTHAHTAIERVVDGDHLTRAAASALAGLAYWGSGDLDAAHSGYLACVEGLQRVGHLSDVLGCSITLADIRLTQGRLREAQRTYEHALQLAGRQGGRVLRGTPDMYVGLSHTAFERGDLAAATQYVRRSQELGEYLGLPQNAYRWRVAMARIREVEGDPGAALELLDEAERVYVGDFSPNVQPISALRARMWARNGLLSEALDWAHEHELSAQDRLSYLREYEHLTLARVLFAQYTVEGSESSLRDSLELLRRLVRAADDGGRTGSLMEILVLLSIVQYARGDGPRALASLQRALLLARPEGYVRVFADEGAAIAPLLKASAKSRHAPAYVAQLLAACRHSPDRQRTQSPPFTGALVAPLSRRELDVLRLLATDLGGPDIARQLSVSLNTLRTHTKSIFAKLEVNNRRAAVSRAGELHLLSRGH